MAEEGTESSFDPPPMTPLGRQRIISVDAFRGYCMFLVIALKPLHRALDPFTDTAFVSSLRYQLTHSTWHGATYLDHGLPAFILVVGMSIAVSVRRHLETDPDRRAMLAKILRRSALLFALGIVYNGGLKQPWPDVRLAGVLQRIAICYLCCALMVLALRARGQAALLTILLLGYGALLSLVPVPGHGAGDYSFSGNLVAYVDRLWLPGKAYYGDAGWDPEGILSTLGAMATCLVGTLTGELLLVERFNKWDKLLFVLLAGFVVLSLGLVWAQWLPLNKPMWTPSFVLFTGGVILLHYAGFQLVCDIWRLNVFFPFVVLGMNSLIAYFAAGLVPFDDYALRLVGGDIMHSLGAAGPLVVSLVEVTLIWLLLYWLYRHNLMMKL